jgi:glycine/D-amino acid oxidase-like deaminating enzyme
MQRVVIIGGGVIGSSIAYHLTANPQFGGSVVVIERDPSYARASSALSASSIRVQFSTPVNIALSQFGLDFIKHAEHILAVGQDHPVLGLREPGYLYAVPEHGVALQRDINAVQRAAGADVALLAPFELASRFPWLATKGIALGSLGLSGEGWFNGPALHQALRTKAIAQGAIFIARAAVKFERADGRVFGVGLADGGIVPADRIVNAAGAWAAEVGAWSGLDLPIRPRRRMVFTFDCRESLPRFPLLIDPTGIWVRPEGRGYICGVSPAEGEPDPDEPALEIDETIFETQIWPVLAERVPAFQSLRLTGGWAGYYDMNLFDHNALVGPHPDAPHVVIAAGFSGHGMQHAPGIGRGVAEMLMTGASTSLDLSPLAPSRLVSGAKLLERCVI